MLPFLAAAGGGGFSQSGSADSPFSGTQGGQTIGGITVGGGLDAKTLAILGAVAVAVLFVLRRK